MDQTQMLLQETVSFSFYTMMVFVCLFNLFFIVVLFTAILITYEQLNTLELLPWTERI